MKIRYRFPSITKSINDPPKKLLKEKEKKLKMLPISLMWQECTFGDVFTANVIQK